MRMLALLLALCSSVQETYAGDPDPPISCVQCQTTTLLEPKEGMEEMQKALNEASAAGGMGACTAATEKTPCETATNRNCGVVSYDYTAPNPLGAGTIKVGILQGMCSPLPAKAQFTGFLCNAFTDGVKSSDPAAAIGKCEVVAAEDYTWPEEAKKEPEEEGDKGDHGNEDGKGEHGDRGEHGDQMNEKCYHGSGSIADISMMLLSLTLFLVY